MSESLTVDFIEGSEVIQIRQMNCHLYGICERCTRCDQDRIERVNRCSGLFLNGRTDDLRQFARRADPRPL